MKKILKIFYIITSGSLLFLTLCGRSGENNYGYNNIEDLYKESLTALKSKDKAKITEFMKKLLPDKNSASYMEKNNCIYRGYPEGLKEFPYAMDSAIVLQTDQFYNYAMALDAKGSLEDLEFIGFEDNYTPEPLNEPRCKCQEVLFTEDYGIFVSNKNNDTVRYKLGELLLIDGKWKSFTNFRLR